MSDCANMLPHTFEHEPGERSITARCKYCGIQMARAIFTNSDCLPEVEPIPTYRYYKFDTYIIRIPSFGTINEQEYTCICRQCEGNPKWEKSNLLTKSEDLELYKTTHRQGIEAERLVKQAP